MLHKRSASEVICRGLEFIIIADGFYVFIA